MSGRGGRGRTAARVAGAGTLALALTVGGGAVGASLAQDGTAAAAAVPASVAVDGAAAAEDRAAALDVATVLEQVAPGVVSVEVRTPRGSGAGSGFVVDASGLVVTNDHVVDGATQVRVTTHDGRVLDAEVLGQDPTHDLAVLQVADPEDLPALELADSDAVDVGDPVVAIGNALGLEGDPTVTTGIVSATGRTVTEPNGVVLDGVLQTDAAINPGNSGGPLVDAQGRVVGITTATTDGADGIGFAVGMTEVVDEIDVLRDGGTVQQAFLGVASRPLDEALRAAAGLDDGQTGALVVEVTPGSAADAAGLRPGDVVVAVGDADVADPADLGAAVRRLDPGERVAVEVLRRGEATDRDVVVGTR